MEMDKDLKKAIATTVASEFYTEEQAKYIRFLITKHKEGSMTVLPAYGRDYKSKAAALEDWNKGLDFKCARSGQYLSKRDKLRDIWIRYCNNTKIVQASK